MSLIWELEAILADAFLSRPELIGAFMLMFKPVQADHTSFQLYEFLSA